MNRSMARRPMDWRLRTSRSAEIGGHRGDLRSTSARERPRGVEGGSGGVRDTGWRVRHGVACETQGGFGWLRLGL